MKMIKEYVDLLVTEAFEGANVQCYLDMDGVLADFSKGVANNTGGDTNTYKITFDKLLSQFPEFVDLADDELKKRLAGPQADPGMKALKKAWQSYRNQKYAVAGMPGFFLNLPIMAGAREMVQQVISLTGKLPAILTAPIEGDTAQCEAEKKAWVEKNLAGLYDGFFCTQNKEAYANSNAILIDDRTKYTTKFEAAGGTAILHTSPADTIAKLKQTLLDRGIQIQP